jgi:bifunctional non-homologous end joining protein LigD
MTRAVGKATSNPAAPGAVRLTSLPLVAPALATLTDNVPTGDQWLYEVKFDGYRMMASSRPPPPSNCRKATPPMVCIG